MSPAPEALHGRIPPHNEDAERALLGALLQAPDRIPDAVDVVSAEDFFARRHRFVFETLVDLSDRNVGVDLLSVGDTLRAQGRLADAGGPAYLAELTALVSSAAHLRHHAEIVAESGTLRRLIAEATGVIEEAHATPPDRESVGNLLDRSEHRVFSVGVKRGGGEVVPLADAMREAFERIDAASHRKELSGLPSGFYELDDMLGDGELFKIFFTRRSSELKSTRRARIRLLVQLSRLTDAHPIDLLSDPKTPQHAQLVAILRNLGHVR